MALFTKLRGTALKRIDLYNAMCYFEEEGLSALLTAIPANHSLKQIKLPTDTLSKSDSLRVEKLLAENSSSILLKMKLGHGFQLKLPPKKVPVVKKPEDQPPTTESDPAPEIRSRSATTPDPLSKPSPGLRSEEKELSSEHGVPVIPSRRPTSSNLRR